MSIATAIQTAQGKVANAYTAVSGKGGTLPATQDLNNLPTAINSIQVSSGSVVVPKAERPNLQSAAYCNVLFSGTSWVSLNSCLNATSSVTLTSGTYTLWWGTNSSHVLIATINL